MKASSNWYELREQATEPFDITRITVKGKAETVETLGRFLLHGLTDTNHLGALMARQGLAQVAEYVRERRVPTKLNIRVAHFGEVVSGHILEAEENLHRPIDKLHYTFNHEWSPQLTDIFAVHIEDEEITAFAYCEVKTWTTSPAMDIGGKGYRDLIRVWREKTPEILHFAAERLWESKRFKDYERLDRAMYSVNPVPELLRLVLFFDENVWSDSLLDSVATAFAHDTPPDDTFVCYLVQRANLRSLVNDSFEKMADLAVHK